jgi:hypothetical protein
LALTNLALFDLKILLDKFTEQALQALADTTKHLIEESDKARAAGDTGWYVIF